LAELLGCPFEVYADPDKELYVALGMTLRTLDLGSEADKPSHAQRSLTSSVDP
jgi:hypothetical protein